MIGKLKDLTTNRDGTQNITLVVHADFREEYDQLYGKDLDIKISKHSAARSLDANARAWVLIDQIAEKTGEKKYTVYQNAIREIGGVSDVVCVKNEAVDTLCNKWEGKGSGWQTERCPSKLPGCTNVTLYYGSSTYNTKQMSDLIDSLIQDAQALGIPTLSPAEKDRLIAQWGRKAEKKVSA